MVTGLKRDVITIRPDTRSEGGRGSARAVCGGHRRAKSAQTPPDRYCSRSVAVGMAQRCPRLGIGSTGRLTGQAFFTQYTLPSALTPCSNNTDNASSHDQSPEKTSSVQSGSKSGWTVRARKGSLTQRCVADRGHVPAATALRLTKLGQLSALFWLTTPFTKTVVD